MFLVLDFVICTELRCESTLQVQRLHFLCDDVLNYVAQPSHPYGSRSFQAFACALYMYLQQLTNAMTQIELKVRNC